MQPGQDDPHDQQPPTPPGSYPPPPPPPPPSDPFSAPPGDGTSPPPYSDPYAAPTSGSGAYQPPDSSPPGGYQPPGDPYSGQQPGYPPPPGSYPLPPGAYQQPGGYQPPDPYQQAGGYQPGYQQPGAYPPPPYGGMPMGPGGPSNTTGLVAMVLGIVALPLTLCCSFLSIPLGVAAVITGFLGKQKADQGLATNGGQAKAGLICGSIAIVLGILSIIGSVALNLNLPSSYS